MNSLMDSKRPKTWQLPLAQKYQSTIQSYKYLTLMTMLAVSIKVASMYICRHRGHCAVDCHRSQKWKSGNDGCMSTTFCTAADNVWILYLGLLKGDFFSRRFSSYVCIFCAILNNLSCVTQEARIIIFEATMLLKFVVICLSFWQNRTIKLPYNIFTIYFKFL